MHTHLLLIVFYLEHLEGVHVINVSKAVAVVGGKVLNERLRAHTHTHIGLTGSGLPAGPGPLTRYAQLCEGCARERAHQGPGWQQAYAFSRAMHGCQMH